MATLEQIREGVQGRLETISGLRAYELVQGTLNVPCAFVYPQDVTYDTTMDGASDWFLLVDVYVGTGGGMRAAQKNMDGYWDPASSTSITNAVDGDKTLGDVVSEARVSAAAGYTTMQIEGEDGNPVSYLTSRFTLEVLA
jgi:hypothetical protein